MAISFAIRGMSGRRSGQIIPGTPHVDAGLKLAPALAMETLW